MPYISHPRCRHFGGLVCIIINSIAAGVKSAPHYTHDAVFVRKETSLPFSSIKWLVLKVSGLFQAYVLLTCTSSFSRKIPIHSMQRQSRPLLYNSMLIRFIGNSIEWISLISWILFSISFAPKEHVFWKKSLLNLIELAWFFKVSALSRSTLVWCHLVSSCVLLFFALAFYFLFLIILHIGKSGLRD